MTAFANLKVINRSTRRKNRISNNLNMNFRMKLFLFKNLKESSKLIFRFRNKVCRNLINYNKSYKKKKISKNNKKIFLKNNNKNTKLKYRTNSKKQRLEIKAYKVQKINYLIETSRKHNKCKKQSKECNS